jgi:hypothetical protein
MYEPKSESAIIEIKGSTISRMPLKIAEVSAVRSSFGSVD